MAAIRKSPQMLELETKHGKSIEQLITEALTTHGSIRLAAKSLEVNQYTFYGWMRYFRVQVKKIAIVA